MTRVFVHGNPETAAVWSPLLAALTERGESDLVCVSPPAFGAPVPDGFAGTPTAYRDWLIGELERFDGPIDLVGHDWGAGHTFAVAAERPDLLRSWATDCAGLLHPDYTWHDAAVAWQTPGDGEAMVAALLALPPEVMAELFGISTALADVLSAGFTDEMGAAILSLYRAAPVPALHDLADRLAAAERRPAMLFVPTEDHYVGPEYAGPVAERLGASTVTLDGLGHWWMWERPDLAADALINFWSTPAI